MCFLDIEMTDPDPRKARIAEIAVYLVSGDLRQQYRVASIVILNASKLDKLEHIVTNDFVKGRFK
jgi:oligoribonuclease (3'-5' exoribonuclease)